MNAWTRAEARLDRFGCWLVDGPGLGFAQISLGVGVWAFAWGLSVDGERVSLWGWRLPAPCGFAARTGAPCPSCGATRAWAWLLAGDPARAFAYHPAAALLLLGLGALVGVGALRIRRGRPGPAWPWALAVALWTLAAGAGWAMRLSGRWPLVIPT